MKELALWKKYIWSGTEFEFRWEEFHLRTLEICSANLENPCHFPEMSSESLSDLEDWKLRNALDPRIVASFTQQLKQIFMVPRLINEFQENHQCRLIETFLCFLLRLLSQKPDAISSRSLETLEMELRCLLAIVGDISWKLVDHGAQLMVDFEAVANEAGCLVHFLFFDPYPLLSAVVDDRIAAFSNNFHLLLKANLQSTDLRFYTVPRTSVVNSVVDDLHHLLEWEDSRIADVKDQINLLHKGLLLLQHSLTNDLRWPQPSEIGELKLPLMRIGDFANRAESLINAYLVRDAPLWYVINTLYHLNRQIEAIRVELQSITQKYTFGGFKVTHSIIARPPLEDERMKGIFCGFEEKETQILDQLVGGGTKSLQVISILGMAGLGKTTLAKKLYNHSLVRDWFDKLTWSVISQIYERQSILAHILIQIISEFGKEKILEMDGEINSELGKEKILKMDGEINSELGKEKILKMDGEILIEHIYKTLKGRRYFVVMDDIWDSNVWYELQKDASQKMGMEAGYCSLVELKRRLHLTA